MHRFSELNAVLSRFLFSVTLFVLVLISFSVSASAEMGPFEFKMEEEPVYIDEKSTSDIIKFYEDATTSDLLSPDTNTFVKRSIAIDGENKPVEKDVVVHTFSITDINNSDPDEISVLLQDTVEDVFIELTSGLGTKYVSTIIYLYGASYEAEYNPETGDISELLLHIALVVGNGTSRLDTIIQNYIKPNADNWRNLPAAQQIVELNKFMLDGRFSYDVTLKQRKSTFEFITDGKGVCEEYAGLTSLFLDDLGFENILVRGYVKNGAELQEHVWNLVKVEGNWYHLDILWDGPIDENGVHTDVTTDFLLKSNSTVKGNHLAYSIYYSYTEKAYYDYDLTPYIAPAEDPLEPEEPEEPVITVTPEMEMQEARNELKTVIDTAFDVVFRNSFRYTTESIEILTPYYTDAKVVYDNNESTIDEIKTQTDILRIAIESYAVEFEPADKTSLYKYLSKAYAAILYDYELYTRESLVAIIEPYDNAVTVYQNDYATQSEVDKAYRELRKVVKQLELIPVDEPEDQTGEIVAPENDQGSAHVTEYEMPREFPSIAELTPVQGNENEQDGQTDQETNNNSDPEDPGDITISDPGNEDPSENVDPVPDEPAVPDEPVVPDEPEDNNVEDNPNDQVNNDNNDPLTPGINEKSGFSIDSLLKSDMLIYIVVALIALGGIIYLIVSRVISKNTEDDTEEATDAMVEKSAESAESAEAEPVAVTEDSVEKVDSTNTETEPADEGTGEQNSENTEKTVDTESIVDVSHELTDNTEAESETVSEKTTDTINDKAAESEAKDFDAAEVEGGTAENTKTETEPPAVVTGGQNPVIIEKTVDNVAVVELSSERTDNSEAESVAEETPNISCEQTAEAAAVAEAAVVNTENTNTEPEPTEDKALDNISLDTMKTETETASVDAVEAGYVGQTDSETMMAATEKITEIDGKDADHESEITVQKLEEAIENAKEHSSEFFENTEKDIVDDSEVAVKEKVNNENISKLMNFFKSRKNKKDK